MSDARRAAGQCPACRRPIAVPGARCAYCGATLPEVARDENGTDTAALADRCLVIIDTSVDVGVLAAALGRRIVEANSLKQRGRHLLHRVLPESEAEAERQRLASLGVSALTLRESAVREASRPVSAAAGDPAQGVFSAGAGGDTCHLAAGDVLLLVVGPVRREPQSTTTRAVRDLRRAPWSHVTEGVRCHVHARHSIRPIEVDPETFVFSRPSARIESTWRRLRAELITLAGTAEIDDNFRRETPALGLSERQQSSLPAEGPPRTGKDARADAIYLDNLPQFRFYSAWHGVLARQLAGLPLTERPPL